MNFRAARSLGIFPRLLVAIAPAALVPLVAVIVVSSVWSYRLVLDSSLKYARSTAEARAAEISADLGEKSAAVRALAYLFGDYETLPKEDRRTILANSLRSVLRTQQEVVAAWTLWAPGALEDDPARYAGSPLSTPNGGFNATWVRTERGTVLMPVEDSVYDGDYYRIPKERLVPALIPPYKWSYTGKDADAVYETTVSAPIIYGGVFKGVVGFDVNVSTYQRIVNSIRIFDTGYAALVTDTGIRISSPSARLVGTMVGGDLPPAERAEYLRLIGSDQFFTFRKKAMVTGVDAIGFGVPVSAGMATPHWMLMLVVPLAEVTRDAVASALTLAFFGIAAAMVVVLAISLVARSLSKPLEALTGKIELMTEGGLPGTLEAGGTDEIARLASSFNKLSGRLGETMNQLHTANSDLAGMNAALEEKVRDRTADLERTLSELRDSQDRMMRSEKFAVLGHLSAEVAHELNTPLAAVRSSADFIGRTGTDFWFALMRFAAEATPEELAGFEALVTRGLAAAKESAPERTSRAAKKAFGATLREECVECDNSLIDDADALGAIPADDALLALLRGGKRDAVKIAAEIAQLARAGSMVRFSADKAAATVSALVSYARTETHGSFEPVDVVKELEELLVLYYGATKRSIKIVRDYRCREPVRGLRDKLNQVWVNLVNNAIQAMDGSGELVVRTERFGDRIAVSVTDSGHGIPDAIKDKIFQPLFTTKRQGEGTGLGLDICKKIVEKHNGEISFESVPGRTVFTVTLPIATELDGGGRSAA